MGLHIYQQFIPLVQGALRPLKGCGHRLRSSLSHSVVFGDSHALLGIAIREITVLVVTRDLQISQDKRFHTVLPGSLYEEICWIWCHLNQLHH